MAERAVARGQLSAMGPIQFVRSVQAPAETPAILATNEGACVFYRRHGTARCEIHRSLGHSALPLACQQFPRVTVIDPRGVSVTLSHYCPTAASLLDADGPAQILGRPGLPALDGAAGLDARDSLPPLLRPDMLMDWEAWSRWEQASVALIDHAPDAGTALARLATVVERARLWTPRDGPLTAWIDVAFSRAGETLEAPGPVAALTPAEHLAEALAAVPGDWRPTAESLRGDAPSPRARRRFLIAHAFANWAAHLGQGLRTWLRSVQAADALVEAGLGVRESDLLLRHLAEPRALVDRWRRVEQA